MKLFLHIGFPKTGSSALQTHLLLNRGWLLERGILFPEVGHTLGYGHVQLFEDDTDASFDALHRQIALHAEQGIHRVILSWEGIALLGPKRLQRICRQLEAYELSIVAYIREQSEVVQSGYFQAVKQSPQKRVMEDYLRSEKLLTPKHLDYSFSLGKFADIFGREKLHVHVYEREQLTGGDIVTDFLDILDLQPDSGLVKSPDTLNASLDPGAVYLLNILDGYYDDPEGREKLVYALLGDIQANGPRGKYFLQRKQVDFIRDHYRPANEQVAREYFLRETGSLFNCERQTWAEDREDFPAYGTAKVAGLHGLIDFRPWAGEELSGKNLQRIASPAAGWALAEPWGIWSDQSESVLRFRVQRNLTNPFASRLVLSIRGRYYQDNTATTVSAPGIEAISLSLVDCHLEIPMSALDENGLVEIRLSHQKPVTPESLGRGNDVRELAFGLESISFIAND